MKKILALILAIIMVLGSQSAIFADTNANASRSLSLENGYALQLKDLGLFKGVSDTEFDLNRAPSRVEAMVMLIRLLGEEETAQAGTYTHPFTDVPSWANSYIGYAYENGLTKGISATKFGTGTANAQMYLTYVLRALGYSDAEGADFTYDNPYTLAESCGLLTESVDKTNFLRADAVTVSYNSLASKLKNSEKTLAESLLADGVISQQQYDLNIKAGPIDTFVVTKVGELEYKITFGEKPDSKYQYLFTYGTEASAFRFTFSAKDCDSDNTYTFKLPVDDPSFTQHGDPKVFINQKISIHSFPASLKDAWQYDYYFDWDYAVKLGETSLIMNQSAYYLDLENETIEGLKPGEHLELEDSSKAYYDKENKYFQFVLPRAIDPKMVAIYHIHYYRTIVVDGEEGESGYKLGYRMNESGLDLDGKVLTLSNLGKDSSFVNEASEYGMIWDITMELVNGATIYFNATLEPFSL